MTSPALAPVPDAPVAEAPAANVVEALTRVIRDLPGIGKDSQASAQQGGYSYRGIEAITREAAELFARHGIVFVPQVVEWGERVEFQINSKPWTDERLLVRYRVFGPGGAQDFIDVGPIPAIGRDNSDKGTSKCMTQAFKYALLQTLCIGDAKDDADGTTHERDPAPSGPRLAPNAECDAFFATVKSKDEAVRAAMNEWWAASGIVTGQITVDHLNAAHEKLAELVGAGGEGSEGASGSPASDDVTAGEAGCGDAPGPSGTVTGDDGLALDADSGSVGETATSPAADALPPLSEAEVELADHPCDLCGSVKADRVSVGDKVRCSKAKDCARRAHERAVEAGTACKSPDCMEAPGDDGYCAEHAPL